MAGSVLVFVKQYDEETTMRRRPIYRVCVLSLFLMTFACPVVKTQVLTIPDDPQMYSFEDAERLGVRSYSVTKYEYRFGTRETRGEPYGSGTFLPPPRTHKSTEVTEDGERSTYDHDGKVTKIVSRDGSVETFVYDDRGNEIELRQYDRDGKLLVKWIDTYNTLGQKTSRKKVYPNGTSEMSWKREYDQAGRPTNEYHYVKGDLESQFTYRYVSTESRPSQRITIWSMFRECSLTTSWTYNERNQIDTEIKPDGSKQVHRYDAQGKLKEKVCYNPIGELDWCLVYAYVLK